MMKARRSRRRMAWTLGVALTLALVLYWNYTRRPPDAPVLRTLPPIVTGIGRPPIRGAAPSRGPSIPGMVPNDDVSVLLGRFGAPDVDENSAGWQPPPPIVTRRLTYVRERVTAVYREEGSAWKLVGFTDPETKKGIPIQTAAERMQARAGRAGR